MCSSDLVRLAGMSFEGQKLDGGGNSRFEPQVLREDTEDGVSDCVGADYGGEAGPVKTARIFEVCPGGTEPQRENR